MSIWTKVRSRTPMGELVSSSISNNESVRNREENKEKGPYEVIAVVNLPGGQQAQTSFEKTGIHLIGKDSYGKEVSCRLAGRVEEAFSQVGVTANSFIGELFFINKSNEAEMIDKSGKGNMRGETLDPPPSMVKSALPVSIAGLFGMNFPDIGDLISLSRGE